MSTILNINRLQTVRNTNAIESTSWSPNPCKPEGGPFGQAENKAIWVQAGQNDPSLLGFRSRDYAIVNNSDLFQAVEDASYDNGLTLEVHRASYYEKGQTRVDFLLPESAYTVAGDKSPIKPGFSVNNHYNGGGSVYMPPFQLREVCTNGMTAKVYDLVEAVERRRHIGIIEYDDIYEMVARTLLNIGKAVEVNMLISALSAKQRVSDADLDTFLDGLEKSVGKRSGEVVRRVVTDNVDTLGNTVWALIQGVSEAYEHNMKHSRFREAWRDNQIDKLLNETGVLEKVRVAI